MKNQSPEPPIWVRPAEACRLASIGMTRLYELLGNGILKSRKLGKARLISRKSLEALGQGYDEAP